MDHFIKQHTFNSLSLSSILFDDEVSAGEDGLDELLLEHCRRADLWERALERRCDDRPHAEFLDGKNMGFGLTRL